MNIEKPTKELRWYDRMPLLLSTIVGLIFFGLLWGFTKLAQPQKGYEFEKLPIISGIYSCCEAGGRYSKSWVGNTQINCYGLSYYQIGTGRDDCGLQNELNGVYVHVEQILAPTIWGKSPIVSRIFSKAGDHYIRTNEYMRAWWIKGSREESLVIAFFLTAIFNVIATAKINSHIRRSQGGNK